MATVKLPLAFFVTIKGENQGVPPKESQDFKLNLVLQNRACPSITSLFEDSIESHNARQIC